ncbi:MAG TPA: hypothetical protein VLJ61_03850 [Pyrinomonadaceae bacterium]|nr:hypothetical protein [Pyrinomonadaceae bacterium]
MNEQAAARRGGRTQVTAIRVKTYSLTYEERMDGFKSTDEIIRQAFALAFFILGDEAEALSVVREALGKLEVAAAAQVKRLYYTPTRRSLWQRSKPSGSRTKVSLSDLHLLQRLIYVESEPFERAREERRDALREHDLLVHFVKHLIRISIKRNSFYVALGVSRLLHDYSTSETMEIYNVVVQDPERVKDDYYYRSRKGRLLQEIKERFDEFVSVCRVQRGEERLKISDAQDEFAELVAECLRQFSPWHTHCPVPRRYDPTSDEIPTLSSAHQGEEDKAEINRIHAVVHPECYELLTNSLKLEPPALRLSVPRFNLPNGKNNMSGPKDKPRTPAPPLDGDELEALKRIVSEQSARRKATHASLLSVAVDRVERARLNLDVSGSTSLALDDGDELVEVRALDGGDGTLLATHLLGGEPGAKAATAESEIVLEGGQKLTFKLSHGRAGTDEAARAFLNISYSETEWLRAASLFLRRLTRRINAHFGFDTGRPFAVPAFAALLLFVCAGALALYLFRDTREQSVARLTDKQRPSVNQTSSDDATRDPNATPQGGKASEDGSEHSENAEGSQPSPQSTREGDSTKRTSRSETTQASAQMRTTTPAHATRPGVRSRRSIAEQTQVASSRASSETEDNPAGAKERDNDATRSVGQNAGATALSKVRKVFIEVVGDSDLAGQTSRLLAGILRDGQRLTPTDVKDEADAAFKIKVSARTRAGAARGDKALSDSEQEKRLVNVTVRLVNEDGEVIWPSNGKGSAGNYTGTLRDVTGRIAGDLSKAVLKSDAQK